MHLNTPSLMSNQEITLGSLQGTIILKIQKKKYISGPAGVAQWLRVDL